MTLCNCTLQLYNVNKFFICFAPYVALITKSLAGSILQFLLADHPDKIITLSEVSKYGMYKRKNISLPSNQRS